MGEMFMLFESISAGDRLEMRQKKPKKEDVNKAYVSQVEEIVPSKAQLIINAPVSYGTVVRLDKDEYEALFYTSDGMVSFDVLPARSIKEKKERYYLLKMLSKGEKVQRRGHYRFDCVLPFKFGFMRDLDLLTMSAEERKEFFLDLKHEGIIKDLGGGGIRFLSNEDIEENSKVCCVMHLENDVILPTGIVLHKQYFPKSTYTYQYRIIFETIRKEERDRIIQYIFDEQKKSIQRTKG